MANEGDRSVEYGEMHLTMRSASKPAKSLTFIRPDEIPLVVGSADGANSAMPGPASASTADPVSVKPDGAVKKSKMSAFDKAKLNSGIRTVGRCSFLCSRRLPCWRAW